MNSSLEKFENTKRVRIRKSKKYRQYNGQKIPKGSESVNKEVQTIQWPKVKEQKVKERFTKYYTENKRSRN